MVTKKLDPYNVYGGLFKRSAPGVIEILVAGIKATVVEFNPGQMNFPEFLLLIDLAPNSAAGS